MSSRNTPQKVFGFLSVRQGHPFCDACIQMRLGLKWRQQVQLVTMTLAVTPLFERAQGECHHCHESKQVTSALKDAITPANSLNARARLSLSRLERREAFEQIEPERPSRRIRP
jgi:hypothetical protein